MNSKMYFYCPECGKEIEKFKFKNEKEEKLLKHGLILEMVMDNLLDI